MSIQSPLASDLPPLEVTRQIDALCDEFETALKGEGRLDLGPYLHRVEAPWRESLLRELALVALGHLRHHGAEQPLGTLVAANPTLRAELEGLPPLRAGEATLAHDRMATRTPGGLNVRCPHCHFTIELIIDASLVDIDCRNCGGNFSLISDADHTRDAAALTRIAHFELIERLGMGAFGTVWKARDTMLDRTVALKIPRGELDAVTVEKFMREARAAAQLSHPNIMGTHEVGRHADTLYIVSDYIRGVSLADMLSDHRLGIRESVEIAAKIADALEHAHLAGVVHRDIKPSNVLVDDRGEPHLMDFGLAKRRDTEITITTDGAILGTPAYMSPEQARGEGARVDDRSDIYSLGVVLFQMLTGELPFRGSTRMLLQKVVNDDPPGPRTLESRVPKDLDTICLKCLEKNPARRYASAGDLAADLRRFLDGQPIAARRIGPAGKAVKWARRNPALAGLSAATLVTLLTATMISSYFALKAAQSANLAQENASAVTDTLYDSLVQRLRLTREVREQGYGEEIRRLVDRARRLDSSRVDQDEMRRQFVLSMGDFLAYPPRRVVTFDDEIAALQLSHDRRQLFAGLVSGEVFACDAETDSRRERLAKFKGSVSALVLSDDNRSLLAAGENGQIQTWLHHEGAWKSDLSFNLSVPPRVPIAFSPDGKLVVFPAQATIEVWDVSDQTKRHSLPIDTGWKIRNIAFDLPRGRMFVTYGDVQQDQCGWASWDLGTGAKVDQVDFPSLGNSYRDGLEVSPAGDRLAVGFDEALLVYDLKTLQPTKLSGFDSTKAVAFSPTHPFLAALNIRGSINVWNPATNRHVATLELQALTMGRDHVAFSSDGTLLLGAHANAIWAWDLDKADEKTILLGHEGCIPCAVFHPEGNLLATGGKDDKVRFWDPLTGTLAGSVDVGEAVQTLAFSPEGDLLAVGGMGKAGAPHLRIIDMETKAVVDELTPAMGDVHSLAWANARGRVLLAACGLRGLQWWEATTTRPLRLESVHDRKAGYCLAVLFNPQADLLVWVQNEFKLKAWDLVANSQITLHAPDLKQGWHGISFMPDGQSVIYVSSTGVAQVWNVRDDKHVASFGEEGTFRTPHIALSRDGQWFAALTDADSVSLWHRPTGRHAFSLRSELSTVWSMAWDPTGKHLAVGQSDGGLAVWHLPKIEEKLAAAGLK